MTIQDLDSFGELIATIATLAYLAVQMRQGSPMRHQRYTPELKDEAVRPLTATLGVLISSIIGEFPALR